LNERPAYKRVSQVEHSSYPPAEILSILKPPQDFRHTLRTFWAGNPIERDMATSISKNLTYAADSISS